MSVAPTVSVVMAVYNGLPFLDAAVRSIREQTFTDFEFIIVNDGSVDGSGAVLASHAREDRRIRIIEQENRGLIAALNRGLSEACGVYIARMDADDISLPSRFERQVEFLDRHPDIAVVGGAIQIIDDEGRPLRTVAYPLTPEEVRDWLAEGSPVAHPAVMMRRATVAALNGYRPAFRHAEDYDLWLRVAEVADIANLPDIMLRYRQHATKVSFRHAEQQAVATLAAQAAARLRRRGMKDPADGADGPTEELFAALGLEQTLLDRARLNLLKAAAYANLQAGDIAAGAEHIDRIRLYVDRSTAHVTIADYMFAAARRHSEKSEHIRALLRLIDAARVAPLYCARRIYAQLCQALRSR